MNQPRPTACLRRSGAEQFVVLIVSRVRLYCDALVSLLSRYRDIRAVGTANVSDQTIVEVTSVSPDAVLLDRGSPGSLPFAAALVRARPGTRVLGFGVDDVPVQVLACAEAGLCGYVPAHASIDELADAARRAAAGETICSVEMADSLFRHLGAAVRENVGLTDAGLVNDDAARRLVVRVLRRLRPSVVILPYFRGRHPDHRIGSELMPEGYLVIDDFVILVEISRFHLLVLRL